MRYLYRPSQQEELSVRGRYDFVDAAERVWATETWERYRNSGSPVEAWRSEWQGSHAGQAFALLSHAVVSPEGVERLKLRLTLPDQPHHTLTLTLMPDSILVNDNGAHQEVALPPGYGLVTPLPSLARVAFPFDLASEQRELAMTYLVRVQPGALQPLLRATKFGYTPLGLRDFAIRDETLRAKGWRMEVPGLPPQSGWFDRHGTCLLWSVEGGATPTTARLVTWQRFG